jgi:REP element-mobilizing transposase RayT
MATPPRPEHAGAIHHVTNRGPRKAPMFLDDEDCAFYLRRLRHVARRRNWTCLAYCLMGNHFHLVIETLSPTLGAGMRDLESLYAKVFNERHGFGGATVQGRYGSKLVKSDAYFAQLLRYVALNPAKAGLVTAPDEWRWSSHATQLAHRPDAVVDTWRVAELLEPWGGAPAGRYAALFDPTGPLAAKYGDADPATWRPTLDELLGDDAVAAARRARGYGYRLAEIGAALGVSANAVWRWTK